MRTSAGHYAILYEEHILQYNYVCLKLGISFDIIFDVQFQFLPPTISNPKLFHSVHLGSSKLALEHALEIRSRSACYGDMNGFEVFNAVVPVP